MEFNGLGWPILLCPHFIPAWLRQHISCHTHSTLRQTLVFELCFGAFDTSALFSSFVSILDWGIFVDNIAFS
jgi:hypothetical protein